MSVIFNHKKSTLPQLKALGLARDAIIIMDMTLALFGFLVNAHVIWFFGIHKRFRAKSDKLFFSFALLDIFNCTFQISDGVIIFSPYADSPIFPCVIDSLLYFSLTRLSLYVFGFIACARYYVTCLKRDERSFLDFKLTKLCGVFLLAFTISDAVISVKTICEYQQQHCESTNNTSVILKWAQNPIAKTLQFVNWGVQVITTVTVLGFYKLINRYEEDTNTRAIFQFREPEFKTSTENMVTRSFRIASILGILFLYPQWLCRISAYVLYDQSVFGECLNENAWNVMTDVTCFLNMFMFEITPMVFFLVDADFQLAVRTKWREIKEKLLCQEEEQISYSHIYESSNN